MSKELTRVHLISGFLGVGKTTVLKALIAQKPAHEKWALIVNEFGEIGIDGALVADSGLPMAEIAGGCLCCAAGPQLTATVARLIRQVRPDRLLVEASGLAHAASVIDELRRPPLGDALTIGIVLTVVDVRQFVNPDYYRQPLYRDQVSIADVLVGTKGDLADAEIVDEFLKRGLQLFPPKRAVVEAPRGVVDVAWLDLPLAEKPLYRPYVDPSESSVWRSAGWVFPAETRFDAERLTLFFDQLPQIVSGLVRAKGIFCVWDTWACLNWCDSQWGATEVQWRRDNRFELIAETIPEAELYEQLVNCMEKTYA